MRVLNAKMLALAVAALLTIALLFAAPLSGLASARAEARAGDTVAIAGGDDCDVQTNDDDDANTEDEDDTSATDDQYTDEGSDTNENSNINGDSTTNEDSETNGNSIADEGSDTDGNSTINEDSDTNGNSTTDEDPDTNGNSITDEDDTSATDEEDADDENDGDQMRDEDEDNGGRVVARAGDAVAIAGGGCEAEAENIDTQDESTGDVETGDQSTEEVEDDDEIEDRTGDPDGDTMDTSELNTLLSGEDGSSGENSNGEETANEQASEETMSGREAAGTVTSRNGSDSDGKTGTGDGLGSQQEQSVRLSSSGLEWPFPTKKELKGRLGEPRRFAQDPGADMTLAIRALGLYDVPVTSSNDDEALDRGAVHVPDTAYPWDREDQKNVFLAGHRLGSKKEKSRLLFYSLDELKPGDEIVLKDRKGQPYKYRVRELFKVGPNDAWVADTLVGRDLLTLQTYTLPDSEDRLVVRADRVQPRSEGGGEQRR